MAVFPTLSSSQDQKHYSEEVEDPSMGGEEVEGGYEITRPRHTRVPRKTYTTGYTNLSNADKEALDAFYAAVRGGSDAWEWERPTDGAKIPVRFKGKLEFQYSHFALTPDGEKDHRWNVRFSVREI